MGNEVRLDLRVIEQRVCDITSEQLGIPRPKVEPSSRLIEDLYCDSLDLVELIMELEDEFLVTIPNDPENPVGKSVFTRQPFRLSDLAEIVYCRFLNSIDATDTNLFDWVRLDPSDDRNLQMPIFFDDGQWLPVVGAETLPMVLVSWYGANAYSLWANGFDWTEYQTNEGFLPSEAQWEYAASDACPDASAVEDESLEKPRVVYGQHERGTLYSANTMPMAAVNECIGVSSFGLSHMAGNVWQWCRDWYDPSFYHRPESMMNNPVNREASGVRSERGGSWVGPYELCRRSYRRGRVPSARGRCLGFRCIGNAELITK